MRRGITLVEMMVVLALLALGAVLAVPAMAGLRDRLLVHQAAAELVGAHARARLLARAEGRVALLTLTADTLVVRIVQGPADTVERWRTGGPATWGVSCTGLPRQVGFAPAGVSFGLANGSYTLSRGSARRQVIVSRYGRIRVQ